MINKKITATPRLEIKERPLLYEKEILFENSEKKTLLEPYLNPSHFACPTTKHVWHQISDIFGHEDFTAKVCLRCKFDLMRQANTGR